MTHPNLPPSSPYWRGRGWSLLLHADLSLSGEVEGVALRRRYIQKYRMSFRLVIAAIISLTSACSQSAQKRSPNCAYPPISFIRFGDTAEGKEIASGVMLEGPFENRVAVIASNSHLGTTDKRHPQVYWNGSPIDYETLDSYLVLTTKMTPVPLLVLDFPAGAPCKDVEAVRKLMERRLNCSKSRRCVQRELN